MEKLFYNLTHLRDYLSTLPTTTLVIGFLLIIGLTIFTTWKVVMRKANKDELDDIKKDAFQKRFMKHRQPNTVENEYYEKLLIRRYEEICIWSKLYGIYKDRLLTFGFERDDYSKAKVIKVNYLDDSNTPAEAIFTVKVDAPPVTFQKEDFERNSVKPNL